MARKRKERIRLPDEVDVALNGDALHHETDQQQKDDEPRKPACTIEKAARHWQLWR